MAFVSAATVLAWAGLMSVAPSCTQAWEATTEDVEMSLIGELSHLVQTGQSHRFEAVLEPIYSAAAKNPQGRLGPEAARSALRQVFLQRPGWSLKGLPLEQGSDNSSELSGSWESWVPGHLLAQVEGRLGGNGVGLQEFAVLSASLEDLSRKEAKARLQASFDVLGLPLVGRSPTGQVLLALRTYFEAYLGLNSARGEASAQAQVLLGQLQASAAWAAAETAAEPLDFDDASRLALQMEQELSRLHRQSCSAAREGRQAASPSCLDVSSLYQLCCREPRATEPEPSVLVAAVTDYPGLWAFSLLGFFLAAASHAAVKAWGGAAAGDVQEGQPQRTGSTSGSSVAFCLLCALALAVDLLDLTVIAPAVAVGLAVLAAARFGPKAQAQKAKKV